MTDSSAVPWERLSSVRTYEGHVTLRRDRYRLPDGTVSDWDVLEQRDTVAVVAVTADGRALLFTQFRVGPRELVGELPGGLIDDGESAQAAGARELREETGYAPGALFHAGAEWSGANSTRRKNVVIAADCRRVGDPQWENGETGEVGLIALDELVGHLLSGRLSDAGEALRGILVFVGAQVDDPALAALQERLRGALGVSPSASVAEASAIIGESAQPEPLADFWRRFDGHNPDAARAELESLLAAGDFDPARVAFERASLHDSLGDEADAVPLYREALAAGLADPYRTEAVVQLASSLRNLGDASGAIALLRGIPSTDPLWGAAQAFLALALHSDDKPVPALRTSLHALALHLPRYRRSVSAYADELAPVRRIRAIAVGLVVRDGHVLLEEYAATPRHDVFLRAPGGGIELGEAATVAVRREFAEELDADVVEARLLAVTENIFERSGAVGHEIVHVFTVSAPSLTVLPLAERIAVRDSDTTVGWYDIDALRAGSVPVYPAGVLGLLPY